MVTEQIFLTQDIDFECLGFLYGVCGRTARDWFNKASTFELSSVSRTLDQSLESHSQDNVNLKMLILRFWIL